MVCVSGVSVFQYGPVRGARSNIVTLNFNFELIYLGYSLKLNEKSFNFLVTGS